MKEYFNVWTVTPLPQIAYAGKETDMQKRGNLLPHFHIPLCRHRAKFPGRLQPSILAADELNFRVRNGNGWDLIAISTDSIMSLVRHLCRQTLVTRARIELALPA